MPRTDRSSARETRKAVAGIDDEDRAQERRLRKLVKGDTAPNDAAYEKRIALEAERRARRERARGELPERGAGGEDAVIALLDGAAGDKPDDVPAMRTKQLRPPRTTKEARDQLHAHAVAILSEYLGRPWSEGDTATLRDAVGVDEQEWPDRLALRKALVAEVDEHRALGAKPVPMSVLAAASVLCGDDEVAKPGILPGKMLEKIQAGLAPHRKSSGVAARREGRGRAPGR